MDPKLVFDLGGTNLRTCLLSPGQLPTQVETQDSKQIKNRDDLAKVFATKIGQHIATGSSQRNYILSIAGPTTNDYRTVISYTNVLPDDFNIPLAEMVEQDVLLETREAVRFFVINDGMAGTLAEMGPGGAASDAKEAISIIVGTGVGGLACRRSDNGVLEPLESPKEIGHQVVDMSCMVSCNCGRKGCLETQTSGPAAARIAKEMASETPAAFQKSRVAQLTDNQPANIRGEHISEAVLQNDPFALSILERITRPMSVAITNIFTAMPNMNIVIIGGCGLGFGEHYAKALRQHIIEHGISFNKNPLQIKKIAETQIKMGKYSSHHTNMIGDLEFLRERE